MGTGFKITDKGFKEDKNHGPKELHSQKVAILMTLIGVAKCHNKPYCFISQAKQLDLLHRFHSWNISRRTLNRRLRELEDEGYFIRIRRHIKAPDGHLVLRSTLYKFCGKLFNWLYGIKSWIGRVFSVFAVPRWAQYNSKKESKVLSEPLSYVNILWKTPKRGRASPIREVL